MSDREKYSAMGYETFLMTRDLIDRFQHEKADWLAPNWVMAWNRAIDHALAAFYEVEGNWDLRLKDTSRWDLWLEIRELREQQIKEFVGDDCK
jgi:hypothetical protein